MNVIVLPLVQVLSLAIDVYIWVIIASAVLSWLVAFQVVNMSNPVIYRIGTVLHRLTEPALKPIRRVLPDLGGIDISPILLIFALYFLRSALFQLAASVA